LECWQLLQYVHNFSLWKILDTVAYVVWIIMITIGKLNFIALFQLSEEHKDFAVSHMLSSVHKCLFHPIYTHFDRCITISCHDPISCTIKYPQENLKLNKFYYNPRRTAAHTNKTSFRSFVFQSVIHYHRQCCHHHHHSNSTVIVVIIIIIIHTTVRHQILECSKICNTYYCSLLNQKLLVIVTLY
jgi:hypothetical protein